MQQIASITFIYVMVMAGIILTYLIIAWIRDFFKRKQAEQQAIHDAHAEKMNHEDTLH